MRYDKELRLKKLHDEIRRYGEIRFKEMMRLNKLDEIEISF